MPGNLDGTVALITGASSGIGAATAEALAAQGAVVALVARRKDRLDTLADRIRETGGTALALECDVADELQATNAVARTVSELGRLDTLINNAGVMLVGPAVSAPLAEWRRSIETNVLGRLHFAHAALPHLINAAEDAPRHVADLVNVSSASGRVVQNGWATYNLANHGLGAFSQSLRMEVAQRHVRVSLIEPGATTTELATHLRPEVVEEIRSPFRGVEPMAPADIAAAITYMVTLPRHVAINEMLIRPTNQQV